MQRQTTYEQTERTFLIPTPNTMELLKFRQTDSVVFNHQTYAARPLNECILLGQLVRCRMCTKKEKNNVE